MASPLRFPTPFPGRRTFLAQLGLWGSALAGLPGFAKAAPRSAPRDAPPPPALAGRIGFLLPAAARGLGEDLGAGLDLAFSASPAGGPAPQVELVRRACTLSPSAYRRAAEALLGEDGADLVVVLGQPALVQGLGALFAKAECSLLVVDGGANLVRPADRDPWIFYNTLGAWESSWALGRWATRAYGEGGFLVTSAFEGGHDALSAFRLGTLSEGGFEKGRHIPGMPLQEAPGGLSAAESVDRVRRLRPSFVAALLGRGEGLEFLSAFLKAGLVGEVPLVGTPYLVEEALAAGLGAAVEGCVTASAWTSGLATASNRAFLAAYRRRAGREASSFAALGFDTGRLLVSAMQDGGGHARFVREALERATWEGPGGPRSMDAATHVSRGQVHLSRCGAAGPGAAGQGLLASEPALGLADIAVDGLLRGRRQAVVNPYPVY
ncbi:MAG: ABC transporter substrate-binding protein [Holophagaceae bacterium]